MIPPNWCQGTDMRNTMSIRQETGLESYWNEKLSRKFSLAPVDLLEAGLVTETNYREENEKVYESRSSLLVKELVGLSQEPELQKTSKQIQVLGGGNGRQRRDNGWVPTAAELGFFVTIREVSQFSCDSLSYLVDRYPSHVDIRHGEFEAEWHLEEVSCANTLVFVASQFIQVLSRPKMQRVMALIGSHLVKSSAVKPRAYLFHPLPEDNSGPAEWQGFVLPGAKWWGDSTPYTAKELVSAARRGAGQEVALDVIGKHMYYHQTYSALRLWAA